MKIIQEKRLNIFKNKAVERTIEIIKNIYFSHFLRQRDCLIQNNNIKYKLLNTNQFHTNMNTLYFEEYG